MSRVRKAESQEIQRVDPKDALAATSQQWARTEGRHALDGYLENSLMLHIQGVDAAGDRSARIAIVPKDGVRRVVLVSSSQEVLKEIGNVLSSGEDYELVGKRAKRPSEDVLAEMLANAPLPMVAPPLPAPALPASSGTTLIRESTGFVGPTPKYNASDDEPDDVDGFVVEIRESGEERTLGSFTGIRAAVAALKDSDAEPGATAKITMNGKTVRYCDRPAKFAHPRTAWSQL